MKQATHIPSAFDGLERRSRIRFPFALAAPYTSAGQQEIASGGKAVNISSTGTLIRSAHEVVPGTSIRVVIEWPILIGNGCRLALHTHETVVRSDRGLVAVRFSAHELRTQPKPRDQVEPLQKEIARGAVEQTHDDAFAVERRQSRNAQIDFAPQRLDLDASVLRRVRGRSPVRA